jgi:hypothetical protein
MGFLFISCAETLIKRPAEELNRELRKNGLRVYGHKLMISEFLPKLKRN